MKESMHNALLIDWSFQNSIYIWSLINFNFLSKVIHRMTFCLKEILPKTKKKEERMNVTLMLIF